MIVIQHSELSDSELQSKIKQQKIRFGGNKKLKIYGLLNCKSGSQMKRENSVFFSTEKEAIKNGFRPIWQVLFLKTHLVGQFKHWLIRTLYNQKRCL